MTEPVPDDDTQEIPMAAYVVTCETEGCGNQGIAIPINAAVDDPYVVCGVCSNQITNIESEPAP